MPGVPMSQVVPVLGIVLAVIGWFAATAFAFGSMVDIAHGDPDVLAEFRAHQELMRLIYLSIFLVLVIVSSWIAGVCLRNSRAFSVSTLSIHGVMIFVSVYWLAE